MCYAKDLPQEKNYKLFVKGVDSFESKKYKKAIGYFSKLIKINSNDTLAFYTRGRAYSIIGKKENAIEDYTKVLELNPDDNRVLELRGITYLEIKDYARAIKDFSLALEHAKTGTDILYFRSSCFYSLNQLDSALIDINTALFNNEQCAYIYLRAKIFEALGKIKESEDDFARFKHLKCETGGFEVK